VDLQQDQAIINKRKNMAHKTKKSIPKTPDPNANEIISNFNRTGGTEAEARALQKRLGTIGIFTKPNDSNTWYVDTTMRRNSREFAGGGMYRGKLHAYAAGGRVTDTRTKKMKG
tara:strand:+ start:284 stop:625 length:342 start_codon:yes stop_codon:yes gene_type:complete